MHSVGQFPNPTKKQPKVKLENVLLIYTDEKLIHEK